MVKVSTVKNVARVVVYRWYARGDGRVRRRRSNCKERTVTPRASHDVTRQDGSNIPMIFWSTSQGLPSPPPAAAIAHRSLLPPPILNSLFSLLCSFYCKYLKNTEVTIYIFPLVVVYSGKIGFTASAAFTFSAIP